MRTHQLLIVQIAIMLSFVGYVAIFPKEFADYFNKPEWYLRAKFIHILTMTLFFANAVIGTLWEFMSLKSGQPAIIRYTYRVVTWLDAVFTAPLILVAVASGLLLGNVLGGVWSIGWLANAFTLFLFSGMVWILFDIPMQYRANRLFKKLEEGDQIPRELKEILWRRAFFNLGTILPLLIIFFLMVEKPEVPTIAAWLEKLIRINLTSFGSL